MILPRKLLINPSSGRCPMSCLHRTFLMSLAIACVASTADAQWARLKTPGLPRTQDGKPDLKATAPRVSGKPDLSGLWRFTDSPYANNITVDLKPEEIDSTAAALYKQRVEDLGK